MSGRTAKDPPARRPSAVFGERLREVREGRRLTQRDFVDLLAPHGITLDQAAVSKIEKGQRGVSLDEAVGLCAVLGVSPRAVMFPAVDGAAVALTTSVTVTAGTARAWLDGRTPLREGDNPSHFEAELSDGDRRVARNKDLERIRLLIEADEERIRAGEDAPAIAAVADVIYQAILRTARFTPLPEGSN